MGFFLFATASVPALGPIQSPIQRIPDGGGDLCSGVHCVELNQAQDTFSWRGTWVRAETKLQISASSDCQYEGVAAHY